MYDSKKFFSDNIDVLLLCDQIFKRRPFLQNDFNEMCLPSNALFYEFPVQNCRTQVIKYNCK